MMRKHSFVLDWPEPLATLMSWIVLGLGTVVALVALVQTALSRRNNRWPGFNRGRAETNPENVSHQHNSKEIDNHQKDTDAPR